jgi:hypothetical protein
MNLSRRKPPVGAIPNYDHWIYRGIGRVAGFGADVGYDSWLFNEGAGAQVSSAFFGPYHAGTLTSAPTWGPGLFGGPALRFASGSYVDTGNTVTTSTVGSIVAWINPASLASGGAIVAKWQSSSAIFAFLVNSSGQLECQYFVDGVTNNATVATTTTITVGMPWQVVVTSDGSLWRFYVNSIPQATTQLAGSNVGNWINVIANGPIRIGYDGAFYPFNGTIDHVRIFNRALAQPEIQQLYAEPFADYVIPQAMRFAGISTAQQSAAYRWFLVQ